MVQEITVFDSDEFERLIHNKDIRISQALVSTILNNLTGKKRHIPVLSILVENEQTIYDITVDRNEFLYLLKENLPIHEKNELYEVCAQIVKAIEKLEPK